MIFQLWNVKDAEDEGLVPGLGRSPGGGNGSPLQYSYLGNPPDSGAWRAKSTESQKSQTRLSPRASTHTHTHNVKELFLPIKSYKGLSPINLSCFNHWEERGGKQSLGSSHVL